MGPRIPIHKCFKVGPTLTSRVSIRGVHDSGARTPNALSPRQLLTRLAFKGDQEVFTASWTKVRSKNSAIDQEVAGPLVLALVQHLLEGGQKRDRLVKHAGGCGPPPVGCAGLGGGRFPEGEPMGMQCGHALPVASPGPQLTVPANGLNFGGCGGPERDQSVP